MYWCAGIGFSAWLLFPLTTVVAKNFPSSIPVAGIPALGILLFAGAMLAMQRLVKCPKCKARLARTVGMPIAFSWGSGPRVNFCPYCGVNLDEPVPGAEPVAQTQNPIHPA